MSRANVICWADIPVLELDRAVERLMETFLSAGAPHQGPG
jgi:hypothetical protein